MGRWRHRGGGYPRFARCERGSARMGVPSLLRTRRGELRDPVLVRKIEEGERLRLRGAQAAVATLPAVRSSSRPRRIEDPCLCTCRQPLLGTGRTPPTGHDLPRTTRHRCTLRSMSDPHDPSLRRSRCSPHQRPRPRCLKPRWSRSRTPLHRERAANQSWPKPPSWLPPFHDVIESHYLRGASHG